MAEKETGLAVHLQPGAKRNEIVGIKEGVIYVKVRALPEKGQANRALVELFAETLGVPRSAVSVVRGFASRNKVISIRGLTKDEVRDALARELPCKGFMDVS